MTRELILRIGLSAALVITAPAVPWWVIVLIGELGAFLFSYYAEFIVIGIWIDLTYGVHFLAPPIPWVSIIALGAVVCAMAVRRLLRFYSNEQ